MPTPLQVAGGVVGLGLGAVAAGQGSTGSSVLHLIGYPVACAALGRWPTMLRERRTGWFVAHQVAMASITTGWVLADRPSAAAVNGAWTIVALAWWAKGAGRGHAG